MKRQIYITDIEELTEDNEIQLANGDWFPVVIDQPADEMDAPFFGIESPWEGLFKPSLIELCDSGLITGVRKRAKVSKAQYEDFPPEVPFRL